jgi:hypothetical protein
VDFIFEEATGLPPKSCVEVLADGLSIRWTNIDLSREQRLSIEDAASRSVYDTFQDLALHERREDFWIERISEQDFESGLVVCGASHGLSLGGKLRRLLTDEQLVRFEVEAHIYDPR